MKAGFDETAGFVAPPIEGVSVLAEYLEPDESAIFWMIPSGVKSRSDLAVT